ncbi:nucleolar complex protein 2 homolog [Carya illinoinensis]|uniref:Nucleolar complex protein 2 homolog n=1 Tax=Carya illinoinensis TaxID=32201 RepID=A0A8T1RRU0_CARIL|nr:nucleolar complex protein 2 homolog [Carya illinoinensis]KAG6669917.1 hypothetical protein CIPAW_01G275800 [Carya illinoinensis]KAG6734543.1 hypothetical protein I3842_01G277200 [Carya illinoinensis]
MGKLGKKARKFAKKNLQSVLKRKRKLKSVFKKRTSKRDEHDAAEDQEGDAIELSNGRKPEGGDIEDISLDAIFSEDDSDLSGDDSESDGYLSEDSKCAYVIESGSEDYLEGNRGSALSMQNGEIHLDLAQKTKKLNRLKEKDPDFAKLLESYDKGLQPFRNEETFSDEGETINESMQSNESKFLTMSALRFWCQLAKEQKSLPALTSLINGYRTVCHYGTKSDVFGANSYHIIQNSETFCEMLMFMLHEGDNIFRGLLGISSSNCKKEAILELKNTSKWKALKPLIKSYLRSTLYLLNQVTEHEILAFSVARLRASIIYFAAFPSLLHRLVKISVHLWATGEGSLSSHSFLIIKDVASAFSSSCFDTCLVKAYKAFIGHCQFVDSVLLKHFQFLRNSLVELCSLDVQKSSNKAMICIKQLAKILQQGLQTKKKEALKKICSWQYTNCIDLWVMFIAACIHDYDLQPLLFMLIQIINGVALLFPGPRYLPLRIKCIQWLNNLSSSSGVFIPVTSLVLDVLEYKVGKEGGKRGKAFKFSSAVKLPKYWLKSQNFQEACVSSAIELLSVHFAQWSYHISFPEVATIPLIHLRKFHEITTIERFRRVVKRFIDQVELNVEFVQKKRDEVAFSPKDQQSVESFLQLEKHNGNFPFTQYYRSIMDNAASRNLFLSEKFPGAAKVKKEHTKASGDGLVDVGINRNGNSEKRKKSKIDRHIDGQGDGKKLKV